MKLETTTAKIIYNKDGGEMSQKKRDGIEKTAIKKVVFVADTTEFTKWFFATKRAKYCSGKKPQMFRHEIVPKCGYTAIVVTADNGILIGGKVVKVSK